MEIGWCRFYSLCVVNNKQVPLFLLHDSASCGHCKIYFKKINKNLLNFTKVFKSENREVKLLHLLTLIASDHASDVHVYRLLTAVHQVGDIFLSQVSTLQFLVHVLWNPERFDWWADRFRGRRGRVELWAESHRTDYCRFTQSKPKYRSLVTTVDLQELDSDACKPLV